MTRALRLAFVTAILALSADTARADPITSSQWYIFQFGGAGSFGTACIGCDPVVNAISAPAAPWTFSTAGPATITVQDLFLVGDRFSVFDNAILLGATSVPSASAACGSIAECVALPAFSRGSFVVGAGSHSLTIRADLSPSGSGAAAFRVDNTSTVPEPSTVVLLAGGLIAVGVLSRRKRRSA